MSKAVGKPVPGYKAPVFYPSRSYVRVGPMVVLPADSEYYGLTLRTEVRARLFQHHLFRPYSDPITAWPNGCRSN